MILKSAILQGMQMTMEILKLHALLDVFGMNSL